MADWLADRVRASPDATALIDADSGERLTYAELDERATRKAVGLRALGIEADDHVGIVLGVRPTTVSLVHAVARMGAVLVPLSPRLTAGELEARVRRADCRVLVHDEGTETAAKAVEGVRPILIDALRRGSVEGGGSESAKGTSTGETIRGGTTTDEGSRGEPTAGRDDPLVLLFTSGTTGQPKGVVLTAGNVLASAAASATRLGTLPEDRWLLALSVGGMGGLAPIYRSVLYGTTLVCQEKFDAEETLRALETYECTGISLVPTMLARLLDALEASDDGDGGDGDGNDSGTGGGGGDDGTDGGDDSSERVPASLRCVLLGGAPASRDLLDRCRTRDVPVHPTYGMTETASQVATARPSEAFSNPGTVGRPLFGVAVRVVADGEVLAADQRGELVVGGPIVTPGYYGESEEVGKTFSEHGFHTGDLGYVDREGRVWVTGRLDDRIVTGGQTVDPEEVRGVLREHPAVREAAVVGLDSEEWGERVGALVVPDVAEGEESNDDLRAELEGYCRACLAGYKLPRAIQFTDALPRTESGTVDRVAVRNRLEDAGES